MMNFPINGCSTITNGTTNDRQVAQTAAALPSGSLRLADLSYFSLDELKQCSDEKVFWLTRVQATCVVQAMEDPWSD